VLNIEELGDIDALALGFPCNEFSVVRNKKELMKKWSLYTSGVKTMIKVNTPIL